MDFGGLIDSVCVCVCEQYPVFFRRLYVWSFDLFECRMLRSL